jgi:hypothetical protein
VSDRVIPIWVALSTTGIILLSIFQKPSFATIVLILDLTGRITPLAGCSWYPSRFLKSTAMSTIVCISDSGLGGEIGNINVCAPTCADDVALIAYNPLDIQTMVDIAVDFSKREGYQLQPAKSVILPVKSNNFVCHLIFFLLVLRFLVHRLILVRYRFLAVILMFQDLGHFRHAIQYPLECETNEGFWKIDNRIMPVVDKATHIGITRSDTNPTRTTVDENIRKARRATYILMGTGLHGENGLDPTL